MSNFLDQLIMEDVAKHCPQQFMQYHKCISNNHDDPSQCSYRRNDLSKCIHAKVPSVQKVMANCKDIMKKYEGCIKDNMASRTINENCLGLLAELRECAESQMEKDGVRPVNEMFVYSDDKSGRK
ncbi:hypothetical protein HG536_0C03300 [Torulaspora globosa]|uniref:IMS import disulfide relay-system CHCH-CHCH-like Cx9C domain-containing protein n=1 Tax=Torulaspora globosa TaxID=48254 RepID=A0A7G3ZF75_9SACH|nr:uncharacterized protein HG536_0C03300 [Torulaspora globosa]QLL32161.1 hypothetical protein HG536_0C03300 [Torulaspora globosa]